MILESGSLFWLQTRQFIVTQEDGSSSAGPVSQESTTKNVNVLGNSILPKSLEDKFQDILQEGYLLQGVSSTERYLESFAAELWTAS